METAKTLVNKLIWAYNVQDVWPSEIQSISRCQQLEDEGFGLFVTENNPRPIDNDYSIVCPDGKILTEKDFSEFHNLKYNPQNQEYVKIHKAYMYQLSSKFHV